MCFFKDIAKKCKINKLLLLHVRRNYVVFHVLKQNLN